MLLALFKDVHCFKNALCHINLSFLWVFHQLFAVTMKTLTAAILEEDLTLKSSFQTIFAHFWGVKIHEFR